MPDVDVRTYFNERAPRIPSVTVRTANALLRGGIETMEQLAEANDRDIRRVRNLGDKCFELAVAMRDKYRQGQ